MIEEKLEIIIITYNRANDLENTFKQFIGSPFSKCKITVLDNCSTDETPDVCIKYSEIFSNMQIVRHQKNIGGNPNILRAVETSNSIYTWIICDDDFYDFTDCEDVFDAINNEFDLIIVTGHFQEGWERGLKIKSQELFNKGSNYFQTMSFVPAAIFKTKLFDSQCIHRGYYNVPNLYPHFPFINKSYEENFSIYISKNEIVKPGTHNEAGFSQLSWFIAWIRSCNMIKNKRIRKKAIYFFDSFYKGLGTLFWAIAIQKIRRKPIKDDVLRLSNEFIINYGFSKEQIFQIPLIIFSIIPAKLFVNLIKATIFIGKKIFKKEPPNIIKLLIDEKINYNIDLLRT